MTWTDDGPVAAIADRQGWSKDGPDPVQAVPVLGWWDVPQATPKDDGAGDDVISLKAKETVKDSNAGGDLLYMGTDPTQDFELRIPIRDHGVSGEKAAIKPKQSSRDNGVSSGSAIIGQRTLESGVGGDLVIPKPLFLCRDNAVAGDKATVKLFPQLKDSAAADGSGSLNFSAVAPATTTYSTVGSFTYTIPVWSSVIVLAGVGGGASGQTGNGGINQHGTGGNAGIFNGIVLRRGIEISWSLIQISVVVGAGGAQPANTNWAGPNSGAATSFSITGVGSLSCAGGSGTNGGTNGGGIREGAAAGDYTIDGATYNGGALGGGSGAAGNPPGGGGSGGNGGVFGYRTLGGKGGDGRAWIKARQ